VLDKHHVTKTYGGVEILFHAFLTYEVGAVDRRASFSAVLPPEGISVSETFGMGRHDVEYWVWSRCMFLFLMAISFTP
jgi:hypothetical protein